MVGDCSLTIDLFRLGIAIILFSIMFPLVEFVNKYIGTGTAMATFLGWVIGVILVLISAFIKKESCSKGT